MRIFSSFPAVQDVLPLMPFASMAGIRTIGDVTLKPNSKGLMAVVRAEKSTRVIPQISHAVVEALVDWGILESGARYITNVKVMYSDDNELGLYLQIFPKTGQRTEILH